MTELIWRSVPNADEIFQISKAAYRGSPWSKQLFLNDLRNHNAEYLMVEIAGELVGFVGGNLVLDELSISNVAILPGHQGQRIGEKLLKMYFSRFPKGTRILLEVRSSNQRALRLYERLGFEIYNIREDYYRDPKEDAYLMDLKLS
ncbi:ribosomal protein S18-alanine N-acetyltransferase [Weissella diestrammenae]|uniref:[Ribosomal protein bS18]-alanine N-acetyltransferase n=1 Tax=Weissella diestrammenae TaxID=1162633 RepID=A0A7G9T6U2_9LACO|nr:ribosomal protein S18-alanine N-acetyltransferase [Weissella diestrammenae]MCM0582594.1 ribosomal protein S18-alanine N-acetyltransferase [Weissella diestrammenae]QNN75817.1 ribosomal protein S18-alanine N-acetyltransferase [Weissella diestrammenae]